MKFDCGEIWAEEKKRLEQWHSFYCIWPRRVAEHDCRIFETIERKGTYCSSYDSWWTWEYRSRR